MKKRLTLCLTLAVLLTAVFRAMPAYAAGVSFAGAGALRSGDSVTVVCTVSGSGLLAVEGDLSYDSDTLELLGVECLLGEWKMDRNGGHLLLWDAAQDNPIHGTTPAFSVTFRVRDDADPGSSVSAAVRNVVASSEESESNLGGDSWSADILRPLSGNNKLAHLGCDSGELSPAFDPGISDYRITVPFSVEALSLSTEPAHSRSTVSISGNSLAVGANTVTVTVTAENGSTRRYTITATREQDPNYVPNDDARLANLKPSHGRLSPAFDVKTREYVVYVPFEVTSIRISGTARDPLAQNVSGGSTKKLEVGDNLMKIKCTAEDGETFKVYQVHVWRMPLFAGTLPEIVPPKEQFSEPVEAPEEPEAGEKSPAAPLFELSPAATAVIVGMLVVCGGVAALFWYLGSRNERKKALPEAIRAAAAHGDPLPVTTPVSCYETEDFPRPQPPEDEQADEPLADAALCSDFLPLDREREADDGIADVRTEQEIPWHTAVEALEALDALRLPSTDTLPTAQEILAVLEDTGEEAAASAGEDVPAPPEQLTIPEDLSDDDAVIALAEALVHQVLPDHIARPQEKDPDVLSVDDSLREVEDL